MGKYLLTDLGIICLVFWSIMGVLLAWYIWKLKEFNLDQDAQQQLEDEGSQKMPLVLEAFQEEEIDSFSNAPGSTQPDDPTQ